MKVNSEYRSRWRKKRVESGLCCTCTRNIPPSGKRQCSVCADKRSKRDKERRANGFCSCGHKALLGKSKCQPCFEYYIAWAAKPESKARIRACLTRRRKTIRLEVFSHYGNQCKCCGESNPYFLTIDHINSDGKSDRAKYNSGNWLRVIRKLGYPKHLQLLCWNCNMAKQHYGKGLACPHTFQVIVENQ